MMSLSEDSKILYSERKSRFDRLKKDTPIGIFGSFYESRKPDLISLQQFLYDDGYYPLISEDLEKKIGSDCGERDPLLDRRLSEQLIYESDVHIFILVQGREDEPDNLIQSVSMEIERLHTLDECGQKSANHVAIFAEKGLIGTMGGVCEGLLVSKRGDWIIEEFEDIGEIFKTARQFCMDCIMDIYNF